MLNYYRILGIGPSATALETEEAYARQRARFERLATADRAIRARIAELEAGYAILADPRRRMAYDVLLAREPAQSTSVAAAQAAFYQRAAAWARRVNAALLACALLLLLDWALPLHRYEHETVVRLYAESVAVPRPEPQTVYWIRTEHTTFRLPGEFRHRVMNGPRLMVWQTPLLGVVKRLSVPELPGATAPFRPYDGSIYGTFALLPLLLGAVAGAGVWPGQRPEAVVNAAVVSGLLGLLALGVLLFF